MSDSCKKYTYFITGGGTGGHIYPAIAVAQALIKDEETKDIYYVGNPDNMEYEIAQKNGLKFLPVKVKGMPRKLSFSLINWGIQFELANWKALYYLWKYKPDVILGTGGYVSAPALFAANIIKIPYMIHDCDACPGIVSRFVSPMAKVVSVAFEASVKNIKNDNVYVNGNPIREQFITLTKEEARKKLSLKDKTTVCIMGGSQGAKTINEATVGFLKKLFENFDVQVFFQTGAKHFDETISALKDVYPDYEQNENLKIRPFFDNMAEVLKSSDIVVSRAGSLSLSEICACALAPILIPYPYAAADHQRKNAKSFSDKNACLYLEDSQTNSESLYGKLAELLSDSQKLAEIQKNTAQMAKTDATKNIIQQLKKAASHE